MQQILATIHWPRLTLFFVLSVVIFTITGPFGSYESMSWGPRLLYWTTLMTGCGLFFHLSMTFAIYLPFMARYPRIVRLVIGVLFASIPATLVVAGVEHFIRERLLEFTGLLWLRLWVTVSVVGLVIGYFNFMPPFVKLQLFVKHSEIDIGLIPFFKRLPMALGTKLISISMEDHYAKVVSDKGEAMILIRFGDAMVELENYPGQQIHRSHWVALDGVRAIAKENRRVVIKTRDNRTLPVSSQYENDIRSLIEGAKFVA